MVLLGVAMGITSICFGMRWYLNVLVEESKNGLSGICFGFLKDGFQVWFRYKKD